MSNTIIIPNRLNWIDWAKVIAISLVVFGHIPMNPGNFPQSYITNFHMPLFFLISGYLTKIEYFNTTTLKKYWHTLIIPYICYNIIFYPYWIIRHIVDEPNYEMLDFIKPFVGTLFLQLRTPISDPLNEVTWFVADLLVFKIVLSIFNLHQKGRTFMTVLSIICTILFVINDYYRIWHNIPIVNFFRCFPLFYFGHILKQKTIIPEKPISHDWFFCIAGIGISCIFYGYLMSFSSSVIICSLRYGNAFIAIIGVLCLSRLLNNIHSVIIDNLSIGTIVIMGLHWMLIGITNFLLAKLLHINDGITYPLFITIVLTILFEALLYPIIILFKNKYPFMLGKKQQTRTIIIRHQ